MRVLFSEALLSTLLVAVLATAAHAELTVLDKPMWVFPGQVFRIAVEQPKGSGRLTVEAPPTVKLFDTWGKDAIQRFYFRSLGAGDATLTFEGKAGRLRVPSPAAGITTVVTL